MNLDPIALIDGLLLETVDGPPIYIPISDLTAPSSGPGASDAIWAFIQNEKPKITIYLNSGLGQKVIAPFGNPGPSRWPQWMSLATWGGIAAVAIVTNSLLHTLAPRR